jgi:hypothetical protein
MLIKLSLYLEGYEYKVLESDRLSFEKQMVSFSAWLSEHIVYNYSYWLGSYSILSDPNYACSITIYEYLLCAEKTEL